MLKVHIGLNLASQMKQLHWSYSNIILDKTELWQEILCEIGLPLLHLILFQINEHEYLRSTAKCLLLSRAMESTGLQAAGWLWRARSPLAGAFPPGWGNAAGGTGSAALRPGREPPAGISPKDGTQHGLSIPATRPEKKTSEGFRYETRDPLTSGISSPRNRSCPAPALPWGKLLLEGSGTCEHQQVMAPHRQANARQEIQNLAVKILKFPYLIHYTLSPTAAFPTTPRALD